MQKKILLHAIIFILLLSSARAATIHGEVYDFELNLLKNVIVEIDTSPKQSTIIKDTGYIFNVPPGNYTISAIYVIRGEIISSTKENILVKDITGDYTLDLILFPVLEEDNDLFNISDIDVNIIANRSNVVYVYIAVVVLLVALFFVSRAIRHKKTAIPEDHALMVLEEKKPKVPQEDETLSKVLEVLGKNDGRITQKEIRKQLNLSEAKLSLVITQLEAEEKIKKIKKGRGNIIILNK